MTQMNPVPVKVTNSMGGKKEAFVPADPKRVTFYSCGPTVYGLIHIGNLRAAMTADLIYRSLKKLGYPVTFVRNYTDVDDKIIEAAKADGSDPVAFAERYVREVEKDYAAAGLVEPDHKTKVTDHMPEIIGMIQAIIDRGKAYVTPKGEVFFSIPDFPAYGKLSKKNLEDLIAGARVEVNPDKRTPADFSLWKPAKPGEPAWDSPWGKGRPGWHIECSAMASKWLGDRIDLHHGGSDLIFPHHENEIAQSEAACGKEPYVRYWLHNSMLNINAEKMSKSLGNVIRARDFLTRYGGEITRFFLLSVHYRSVADFSEDTIETALSSLQRLYEAKKQALALTALRSARPDPRAESLWSEFAADCEQARREINAQMANDFNTPGALAALFTLVRAFNRVMAEPRAQVTPSAVLGAQELIRVIEDEVGGFLGVGRLPPDQMLARIGEIRAERAGNIGSARLSAPEIEQLLHLRAEARKAKDFAESDRIRKHLDEKGVAIKDGPQGTTWEYK